MQQGSSEVLTSVSLLPRLIFLRKLFFRDAQLEGEVTSDEIPAAMTFGLSATSCQFIPGWFQLLIPFICTKSVVIKTKIRPLEKKKKIC